MHSLVRSIVVYLLYKRRVYILNHCIVKNECNSILIQRIVCVSFRISDGQETNSQKEKMCIVINRQETTTEIGGIEYVYDELGRLIKVSYPDGTVLLYEYDNAGNIVNVKTEKNEIENQEKEQIEENDIETEKDNNSDETKGQIYSEENSEADTSVEIENEENSYENHVSEEVVLLGENGATEEIVTTAEGLREDNSNISGDTRGNNIGIYIFWFIMLLLVGSLVIIKKNRKNEGKNNEKTKED